MGARRFDPSSTPVTVALVLLLNGLFYTAFVAGEDETVPVSPPKITRSMAAKSLRNEATEVASDTPSAKPQEADLDEEMITPPALPSTVQEYRPPRTVDVATTVLWTERKLSEVSLSIPASFGSGVTTRSRGRAKRDGADDIPFVRVTLDGAEETKGVQLLRDSGNPTPYIMMKDVLGDTSEGHRPGDIVSLSISSGQARTKRAPGKVGNGLLRLSLGSLADLETRAPLTIHLTPGGWEPSPATGTWLALPGAREGEQTLSIHLANGEDLPVFMPLIRAAQGMTAIPGGEVAKTQEGYCFVRRGEVVATVWGAPLTSDLWAKIATGLKSSLIYRGAASAFIMSPRYEQDFQKKLAAVGKWAQDPIYVYDSRPGDGRYPVLPGTMLGEPEIASYLQSATGLFTKPVQLLSPSAMLAH